MIDIILNIVLSVCPKKSQHVCQEVSQAERQGFTLIDGLCHRKALNFIYLKMLILT